MKRYKMQTKLKEIIIYNNKTFQNLIYILKKYFVDYDRNCGNETEFNKKKINK